MTTPMMKQWQRCKDKAQKALLLFRLGDFYEAFYEDAKTLARDLELTLTKRQDIPMAGIPVQTLETYLEKLVQKGHVVAIAEQTEDPKTTKGIVNREITRTVSPATIIGSTIVPEKSHNFFAALSEEGLACVDHSTGALILTQSEDKQDLFDELVRRAPSELLIAKDFYKEHETFLSSLSLRIEEVERPFADPVKALLSHLEDTLCLNISHIEDVQKETLTSYMSIDQATLSHLELEKGLFPLIDFTLTPMGARLLKSWLLHPLLSKARIEKRQEAVLELIEKGYPFDALLKPVRDLERLMMRIVSGSASPRDLTSLAASLKPLPHIIDELSQLKIGSHLLKKLSDPSALVDVIEKTMVLEPPPRLSDGGVIRSSASPELLELRTLKSDSHAWMARYQNDLKEEHGIKTLKVGYNRAFGYFIEVSRAQSHKMPDSFQRRQTLVNNERFISPELKEFESKILSAEDRIGAIESKLFHELRLQIANHAPAIRSISRGLADLDALLSLAKLARSRKMVCPVIDDGDDLYIEEGRHLVVENHVGANTFIPNDTVMNEASRLMLITGPNMAGKSTYIRQVALLTILAQMGSFLPAKTARIGLVDKLFSRIGASDDLARGQSTFMVEMTETAHILKNATRRSLVILDEIGRGTSTYDGISIAWSVAEYLLMEKKCKTLFATHYFELTDLEGTLPGAANYNIAVEETEGNVLFLHKIVKGFADKSYGIHVARLAGLPFPVLERAYQILDTLENKPAPKPSTQKKVTSPAITKLKEADPNHMTPLQALEFLAALKHDV